MSLNARCYCDKCGNTYSLFTSETKLLPGMVVGKGGRITKKPYLKTWVDWVEHIATHCPDCRYRRIPPDCLKDHEKQQKLYNKFNPPENDNE